MRKFAFDGLAIARGRRNRGMILALLLVQHVAGHVDVDVDGMRRLALASERAG